MNFFKLINIKKAAMFGLDARIALAILAIVSLSVSLVQRKKVETTQTQETKLRMEVLASKMLKHWEKLRFDGYYTVNSDDFDVVTGKDIADIPGFAKEDKVKRFRKIINAYYKYETEDVTHPYNGETYNYTSLATDKVNKLILYLNYKKDFFKLSGGDYMTYTRGDIITTIYDMLEEMQKEEGAGLFSEMTDFETDPAKLSNTSYVSAFNAKRNPNNRDIVFYSIVEMNVDSYSPSDYIVNFVMYSRGKNRKLETTMPKTIADLESFAGAQGDDIVHIFNTKSIYLRAKAEGLRRLKEIKEKLVLLAESNYLDRMSLCVTESTPSASCDLDADNDFDTNDENLLLDYNPFPKSSLDTSGAKYYQAATAFNYAVDTGSQSFLSGTLGLPEYYAYDLFGNFLNYQSNVGLKTKGPYSMEVWY